MTSCIDCSAGKTLAAGASLCVDCGEGKYSGEEGATVCVDCGAGTYINVTGGATCLECSRDPCPFPGTFELFSCNPGTNNVCEVYVPRRPSVVKIVINWKWTLFSLVIGVGKTKTGKTISIFLKVWRDVFSNFGDEASSTGGGGR